MAQMNIRDLGRVREITAVLVRHGFGHLVRLAGLDVIGEPEETSLPLARRLCRVLTELGPTFVKLGQVLSVRPDIVPRDMMEELSTLQDRVPPASFEEIEALILEELGRPISECFRELDVRPLASASIAQVHRAVLADGSVVAVKVQRPGIEGRIRSDLHILTSLAQLISGRLKLPGFYTPVGIVQEFETAIHLELDFLQEARAAARFRQNFQASPRIIAPRIHGEWSTRRVLVMELLEGRPVSELTADTDAARSFMGNLIEATYQQVFEHGYFHGDPHPGNLLVVGDDRLAFLDFGLTGQLTAEMQDVILTLFLGLVNRDAESVALTLYRAGATDGRVDLKGFRREIERLLTKYHGATLAELSQGTSLVEFISVASRFRIQLVPEYAVLARATSILDGIARKLIPEVDIVDQVQPYAARLVGRRLSPERVGGEALRVLQHAQITMRDVPIHLSQLMADLEQGNLRITTADPDAGLLRDEIRHAGIRVAMALCVAALTISGAMLIAPYAWQPWYVPINALLGVGVVSIGLLLLGALVVHYLFAARIHPREWRRRALAIIRFFLSNRGG